MEATDSAGVRQLVQKWKDELVASDSSASGQPLINITGWISRTTLDIIGQGKVLQSSRPGIRFDHVSSRFRLSFRITRQCRDEDDKDVCELVVSVSNRAIGAQYGNL